MPVTRIVFALCPSYKVTAAFSPTYSSLVLTVREDGGVVKPARPVATGVNRTGAGRC
jgi:hypothetical protein